VEPDYKLGNIHATPMVELVASAQMRKFGDDKRDTLTKQCQECDVRFLCNGGCPKDRFGVSCHGEPGQNYLCPGLELFFNHSRPAMQMMGQLLKAGRAPSDVMEWYRNEDSKRGPYQPCSCGSGRKFKFCHGNKSPASTLSGMRDSAVAEPD
jgi:uncharacterized protein